MEYGMYYINRIENGRFIKTINEHSILKEAQSQAYILNCNYCYNVGVSFTIGTKAEHPEVSYISELCID